MPNEHLLDIYLSCKQYRCVAFIIHRFLEVYRIDSDHIASVAMAKIHLDRTLVSGDMDKPPTGKMTGSSSSDIAFTPTQSACGGSDSAARCHWELALPLPMELRLCCD